jgi:hypothetical protein
MRREFAVVAVAVIAACSQEGSTASGQGNEAKAGPVQTSASTPEGLALFHVAESGDGRVSFASSSIQGDYQVLSDLVFVGDDGAEVRAETLRLAGARDTADGPVFDSLEILGLTGGDATEGAFHLNRIVIDKPTPMLASLIAQALSDDGVDEDADWGDPSDYGFQTFALEGFSADIPSEGAATPADVRKKGAITRDPPVGAGGSMSFDDLLLSGLGDSKLASFSFDGFSLNAPMEDGTGGMVTMNLDSISMSGLDMSGIDELADADLDDPEAFEQAMAESGFSNPFLKRYDDYALEGFAADIDGVLIGLERLGGTAEQVRGGGVETSDTLQGLTVSFDSSKSTGAQGLAGLQMLGYDSLEINGRFVQNADQANDRLSSDEYVLEAVDAFSLALAYDITGIGAYLQAAAEQGVDLSSMDSFDPEAVAALVAPLMINGFELKITDDSLIERALQAVADQQGSTPDEVRVQATAMMAVGALMAPPGAVQTLVSDAIGAAGTFLEEQGTLRITVDPEEPVSIADLMAAFEAQDFDTALSLLNVEVVAEE